MDLDKVVQLIRGQKGTEVRLTISPANDRAARREVTLVRDEIKLEDSEAKATLIETPDGRGGTNRIGVIDVPSFYIPIELPGNAGHSKQSYISTDVAKLIQKLKSEKVGGIVLDLRNNPGGSLEEAIKFTGLFIKDGPVVLARAPDGQCRRGRRHRSLAAVRRPARGHDQPFQRVRRRDRRRRVAGLWPRHHRWRHLHARQGHGAKPDPVAASSWPAAPPIRARSKSP